VVEERWPKKRGLMEESDANESRDGVQCFESGQEHDPSHDVDSGRDDVTLDRRQGEEYRPTEGRANSRDKLHARMHEVD